MRPGSTRRITLPERVLGRAGIDRHDLGLERLAELRGDASRRSTRRSAVVVRDARPEDAQHDDDLALDLVRDADRGRLQDGRMGHGRRSRPRPARRACRRP